MVLETCEAIKHVQNSQYGIKFIDLHELEDGYYSPSSKNAVFASENQFFSIFSKSKLFKAYVAS